VSSYLTFYNGLDGSCRKFMIGGKTLALITNCVSSGNSAHMPTNAAEMMPMHHMSIGLHGCNSSSIVSASNNGLTLSNCNAICHDEYKNFNHNLKRKNKSHLVLVATICLYPVTAICLGPRAQNKSN